MNMGAGKDAEIDGPHGWEYRKQVLKMLHQRAGETVLWIKCLWHKHEDRSSDPQNSCKRWEGIMVNLSSRTLEGETTGSLEKSSYWTS